MKVYGKVKATWTKAEWDHFFLLLRAPVPEPITNPFFQEDLR